MSSERLNRKRICCVRAHFSIPLLASDFLASVSAARAASPVLTSLHTHHVVLSFGLSPLHSSDRPSFTLPKGSSLPPALFALPCFRSKTCVSASCPKGSSPPPAKLPVFPSAFIRFSTPGSQMLLFLH
ncbi:hypothetical protein ACFXTN_026701 [Malus domestica]